MTKTPARAGLPEGYSVARSYDKHWYALREDRYYDIDDPEGTVFYLEVCRDLSRFAFQYPRREEAVRACWQHAEREEAEQREKWERLAVQSDIYPDRCVHYLEVIEELTGYLPHIDLWPWRTEVYVKVYPARCFCCGTYHDLIMTSALTIEEALEEAAEQAYAAYAECMQSRTAQKLITIRIA